MFNSLSGWLDDCGACLEEVILLNALSIGYSNNLIIFYWLFSNALASRVLFALSSTILTSTFVYYS